MFSGMEEFRYIYIYIYIYNLCLSKITFSGVWDMRINPNSTCKCCICTCFSKHYPLTLLG
jgi:hypothetical protein